jgi:hypothetical protein
VPGAMERVLASGAVQELRAGCVTKFKTRGCCLCGAHPIV